MISRRTFLLQILLTLAGCQFSKTSTPQGLDQITIGTVAYGEGSQTADQYQRFTQYLEQQTKSFVQLEPAYNEVQAIEQIQRQAWSLVFAPPGLAAIAVAKAMYVPLFPLSGVANLSSILVVRQDSPIRALTDVNGQVLALGQPGSATAYYVPLYELYGTEPAEVRIAPTPKMILEWLARSQVGVGAMAKNEFDRYRSTIRGTAFRVLHTSRRLPSGSVLISPKVDRNLQEVIQQAMNRALPTIAQEAGYIPNAQPPNYETLITFIQKVEPIETHIQEKPAPLYTR
ncbi:MAG TPA: PhnD/SsuA/transferrin family substrate-binding protein [Trichocoleus sp.]|jgi:phosphonate transport system substrate-binding protein